jgi:hypothetical protein
VVVRTEQPGDAIPDQSPSEWFKVDLVQRALRHPDINGI